jgi:hypothetical protein
MRTDFTLDKASQDSVFGGPWIISPSYEPDRDRPSISVEVTHDFSGDPDEFLRVAMWDGDRWTVEPDDDFERRITEVMEHEDHDHDHARALVEARNVMSYRQAAGLLDVGQYDAMIAFWQAISQFAQFAISDRRRITVPAS